MRGRAGGWIALAVGGLWGEGPGDAHLIAAEGIYLGRDTNSFYAEMAAAVSATDFLHSLCHSFSF